MLEKIKIIAPKTHAELSKFITANETKAKKIDDYERQIKDYEIELIKLENQNCKEPENTKLITRIESILSNLSGLKSRVGALNDKKTMMFNREEVDKLIDVYSNEAANVLSPKLNILSSKMTLALEQKQAKIKKIEDESRQEMNNIFLEQNTIQESQKFIGQTITTMLKSFGLNENEISKLMNDKELNYYGDSR